MVFIMMILCDWRKNTTTQKDCSAKWLQARLFFHKSIADILSGKVNPSGKLAVTFPINYDDVSSAKNFPGKEFPDQATKGGLFGKSIPAEVVYEEGIYVGYRYNNSFNIKPAYEFGYGLSYTSFKYSPVSLSTKTMSKNIIASVTITNNGKVAGKEIVQLYISAPKGKLDKPSEELKAFSKTKMLQPGESQTINFTLSPSDLSSYDTNKTAWVADGGTYTIKIGASSEQIKQTANFLLPASVTTEKCNKVMTPVVQINEIKKLAWRPITSSSKSNTAKQAKPSFDPCLA